MIKGLSEKRRLSRLGKIRLGVMVQEPGKKHYPRATDHFVVPAVVAKLYGDEPKDLPIMFPGDDPARLFPQDLKMYRSAGLWCAGNGGSQANAAHLSLHLQECGIRAVEFMGEAALSSAFANDATYEASLAKRLRLLSRPSDLLIVLTGSGNSINIITALAEARRLGLDTIGLLGFGGGMAKGLCRVPIVLTATSYGPVEDAHSAVVHMLAGLLSDDDAKRGPALAR
mgnify:CR=1 FL=1